MSSNRKTREEPDVLIVGGGASGALVARLLADRGARVTIIEAGPRPVANPRSSATRWIADLRPYEGVDESTWRYRSAGGPFEWARVRALGGRTLVWGGWLYRSAAQNLVDARAAGTPWPFTVATLTPYFERVERILHVRGSTDGHAIVPDSEYEARAVLHPRFRAVAEKLGVPVIARRSTSRRGRPTTALDLIGRIEVISDMIVLRVIASADRRARGVVCRAADGTERSFRAAKVVLAASAIETARILVDSQDSGVENVSGEVGRGLVDHMVASCLLVSPRESTGKPAARDAENAFVPRFVNVGRSRARGYLGGFSTEIQGPADLTLMGLDTIRALGLQPADAAAMECFAIHAIGELFPSSRRYVSLSRTERDAIGRAVPIIHQSFRSSERAMARDMEETCVAVADALSVAGSFVAPLGNALSASRVGHEAGTCRMGAPRANTPVDSLGRYRGTENLYVVDSSVMPTALDRHPTLTLFAIAARIAENISR